jgi:flagellar motor switch/type III secretory pathway protein FliN
MAIRTQRFSFEGLPHLPAAVLHRSRMVAGAVARIASATLALRGVGRVTVTLEGVDLVPWDAEPHRPGDGACVFTLAHFGSLATLTLDPFLALALVRSVFGAAAPVVARPLGRAERGIVGALVASALAARGGGLAVGFDLGRAGEPEQVRLHLQVSTAELTGAAHLDVPVAWLGRVNGAFAEAALPRLETVLCIELARTTIERGAWATAEAGDAVLFAGVWPLASAAPWLCQLRVGPHAAPGEVLPDGQTRRRGPFTPTAEIEMKETSVNPETAAAPEDAPVDASAEAARVLAAAPVEVVAELGRLSLRGDELLGLCRGSVLALGPRRAEIVSLRVGGVEWAVGELVTIDDQLGVRITELRRRS